MSALFLSLAAAHAQTIRRLDGTTISAADATQRATTILQREHVTGAQIAILSRNRVVWQMAYGLRQKDPDLPMSTTTSTWAGSLTKTVFAAYVLQLTERGEIRLDDTVMQYLPRPLTAYGDPYSETATAIQNDPRLQRITIRMLLSHTSGLGNLSQFEPDHKLHFHSQPGEVYRYSGDGLNLLQLALEQKYGKPLEQQMDDAIFKPLGMSRTGMTYRKEWADNIADRFDASENFHAKTRRSPAHAAGSMTTNVQDFARFLLALNDGKVIGAKMLKQMTSPAVAIHAVHQFPFANDASSSPEVEQVGLSYGLGVGLLTKTRFGPAFFKEGHGDGAQNYFVCFRQSSTCMVIFTNSDNGELAFQSLLEELIADDATPLEWECYTGSCVEASRKFQ